MKVFKLRKTNIVVIYFLLFLYLEVSFKIVTGIPVFNISLLYIVLNCLFLALAIGGVHYLFNHAVDKVFFFAVIFLSTLVCCVEFCVFKIFSFYFSVSLLHAADQVVSFTGDAISLIWANIEGIFLLFLPFIALIIGNRFIVVHHKSLKKMLVLELVAGGCLVLFFFSLNIKKDEEYSAKKVYFDINNVELSVRKFGVLHGFFLDVWRSLWGFEEEINLETPIIDIVGGNDQQPVISYEYNNLDIDFASLMDSESDATVKEMHAYFQNEVGTKQNQYTGFFEGKNLILFMAESFNEIAVDEKRTPTLYKLIHNGFVFNQFYTPTISSTIGGEFQELMGMVAESGFLKPWKSGENSYPFGIATLFKEAGYATYAYHDHTYTFQSRNKYLKAIGFDNFTGCRNGLEKKINCKQWPESDLEMIEATVDDYIFSDKPFFTYYVTVSGHGDYGWASTAMGRKHKDEVINLPYSEKVLSYLAANIELDRALEVLVEKLDAAGKLDDTVIALVGDHYPYFLSVDEINEVSSYKKDSVVEINHSNFILWNNKMEKVEVNKLGSQIDVLPTLYNVFGLSYDSRLIIGKDILSTEPGLAIFANRSWVSDYGTYFSSSGTFVLKEGMTVADDYVLRMNKIVANKMNMSKLIMEKDYYKYFKN